jgi:hypothetical protein
MKWTRNKISFELQGETTSEWTVLKTQISQPKLEWVPIPKAKTDFVITLLKSFFNDLKII